MAEISLSLDWRTIGLFRPTCTSVIEAPEQLGTCRCSAVLSSNQHLQAVVRIEQKDANGSALGLYRGALRGGTTLFYAPFHAVNGGAQTDLGIMNAGTSATSFTLDFFNFDGTPAGTHTSGNVNPAQTLWIDSSGIANSVSLANGVGYVKITSQQPMVAVAVHTNLDDGFIVDDNFARTGATDILMPRVNNSSTRGSHLYFANIAASAASVQTRLRHPSGANVTIESPIQPNAVTQIAVSALPEMAGQPSPYSAIASNMAPTPIVGWEQSVYAPDADIRPVGSYGPIGDLAQGRVPGAVPHFVLPRIVRGADKYSIISIQNEGVASGTAAIIFLNAAGAAQATLNTVIPAGMASHVATSDIQMLPIDFSGAAVVSSDQPIVVFVEEVGPRSHQLAVQRAGNGGGSVVGVPSGINCGQSCAQNYPHGTVITLTATANPESAFSGWAGACAGVGPCQVIVDAAKEVTATFNTFLAPEIAVDGPTVISQTIEFTATLGLNSYDECTWDFDDGATAPCQAARTAESPDAMNNLTVRATHFYAQPGQYTVTVTARNAAGEVRATLDVNIRATADSAIFLPVITR